MMIYLSVVLIALGGGGGGGAAALIAIDNAKDITTRNLESTVVTLIEDFARKVIEYGLDPYFVERTDYDATLIPNVARVAASAEELLVSGASNLVINQLSFSTQHHELFVEVTLPQIFFSAEEFLTALIVYGRYYKALTHGSVAVKEVRLAAKVRFAARPDVRLESVQARATLGSISSNIETNVLGVAIGPLINKFMNQDVPKIWKNNSAAINAVLSAFIKNALNHTMTLM